MIVVSDSTILIGLAKIGKLALLRDMFSKIYIPEEVYREVVEKGAHKPGAKFIQEASWIEMKPVTDVIQVLFLMPSLEKGEAEVLGLAKEIQAELILVDEEKARKSAIMAGFDVMGILGVLRTAKKLGLVTSIRADIEELQRKKFRLSEKIIRQVLQETGETG